MDCPQLETDTGTLQEPEEYGIVRTCIMCSCPIINYYGVSIKVGKNGETCSNIKKKTNAYRILVRKPKGKSLLERTRSR